LAELGPIRSRVRVLEAVDLHAEGITCVRVAEEVGLHPSTVRKHLKALALKGYVEQRSDGDGVPTVYYPSEPIGDNGEN